jgi:alcohol dehydrogenase
VIEVGAAATDADRALLGRPATAEINNTCLALRAAVPCPHCAAGMPEHCSTRTVTGIIRHDGGFAEEAVVPLGALHPLTDAWPEPLGIFVEPLAAALQTFERRPLIPPVRTLHGRPEFVVVLGLGRLGVLIAAVARSLGARVLGVARSEAKAARAEAFGIDVARVDALSDELLGRVRDATGGLGADIVVEVTGNASLFERATRLVRPRGTVCLKSTPGTSASAPLTTMVVDEVDVSCSRCGPFAKAIAFQQRHGLPLASLITHEFPLADLPSAFATAELAGKVVIRCDR